jgi:hypothetical protein
MYTKFWYEDIIKIYLKEKCLHVGQIFLTHFMLFSPEKHTQKDTQPFAYYYYTSDSLFTGQKLWTLKW